MNSDEPMHAAPADGTAPEPSRALAAADVDAVLVADDLAGALEPREATELAALLLRDPVAAGRYAGFARDLDGLAAVLADQPVPPVPDDVLLRLNAALEREVDTRAADETARATAVRRLAPRPRRRPFAGWAAGLGGVAALAAVVAVVVQTGGATGSSSSTSASAPSAAAAVSQRAQDGAGAAGAAAAGTSSGDTSSGDTASGGTSSSEAGSSAAAAPEAAPIMTVAGRRAVTAASLASVVRAVYPVLADTGGPAGPTAAASPLLPVTQGVLGEAIGCRPAGVALTVRLLATAPVIFADRPAVLLVLVGDAAHPGSVRATVVARCGGPPLLSRLVTVGG